MANPVTDNIAVWTAAQTPKGNGGRGNGNGAANKSAYGIKKLRELILELAVRGKLVPQDPNDEPASVLLEKIAKEKARLVKEGKIRKQMKLPANEEGISSMLPVGWQIERLQSISWFITKGATPTTYGYQYTDKGVRFVKVENIENGRIISDGKTQYIDQETHNFMQRSKLEKGDLLFSIAGTIGKTCIVYEQDLPANTNQALAIIRGTSTVFLPKFLLFQLDSFVSNKTKDKARGGAMNNVSLGDLNDLLLYIPPLAEQHRIVAKVDELMALCDRLEERQNDSNTAHQALVETLLATLTAANQGEFADAWQRIADHFATLFTTDHSIDQLKQTILQLAVMGKLVPQDPTDEPASVLLKKIAAEKARLIKEEGLRTTAKTDINRDEEFVGRPNGWGYCRLGNLTKFIDYRGRTPEKVKLGITLITAKNVRFGYLSHDPAEYISATDYQRWMTRGIPRLNDILFTTEAPLGNVAIVDIVGKFALAQRVICFQLHEPSIAMFLRIQLMSTVFQDLLRDKATGMTATGIKAEKLKEIPMALPPLAEQQRIVAKVDELMALCDGLKARLKQAQVTQIQLADAVVEQAVA